MLRLLLGLVVAIGILYGGLHLMGKRAGVAGAPPGQGPPQARKLVNDYRKIETQNRAQMERTMETAEEAR